MLKFRGAEMQTAMHSIQATKASEGVANLGNMAPPASRTPYDDKLAIGYNNETS